MYWKSREEDIGIMSAFLFLSQFSGETLILAVERETDKPFNHNST